MTNDFEIQNGVLTKYTGTESDVTIPDGVTALGECAFSYCTSLRTVTAPDGVTKLGYGVFSGCTHLQTVTLPRRLTEMGGNIFGGCKQLQSVTIPDGVTEIGWDTFRDCEALESVTIPDGVKIIYPSAFLGCKRLQSIVIPDSVTKIQYCAFKNCENLEQITLSARITSIDDWMFEHCKRLQSVIIPNGVTSIGLSAFEYCTSLQSVTIPDGVTEIHLDAFRLCVNLHSIVIPESVRRIGDEAFRYCTKLENVSISGNVTKIEKNAFADCGILRTCVLAPESESAEWGKMLLRAFPIESLIPCFLLGNMETNEAFRKLLKSRVTAKAFRQSYIPFLIQNEKTELFIRLLAMIRKMEPEEIDEYLRLSTERNQSEITTRLMMYKQALYPPEKLAEMEEIEAEKEMGFREKTLADYRKLFAIRREQDTYVITKYKGKDPNVVLPASIHQIPVAYALSGNKVLQTVWIEDGTEAIGDGALAECVNLKSIHIPDSVKEISFNAFLACKNLTIYAHEGSYAQAYAAMQKIPFEAI